MHMAPWTKASSSSSGTLSLILLISSSDASLPRMTREKPMSWYILALSELMHDACVERWSWRSGKFFLRKGTVPISETMNASKGHLAISSLIPWRASIWLSLNSMFIVTYIFFPVLSLRARTRSRSSSLKLPAFFLREKRVRPM